MNPITLVPLHSPHLRAPARCQLHKRKVVVVRVSVETYMHNHNPMSRKFSS